MYFRILTVAIVAFWSVMTGLLVQSVYFPESNRFASVDPRHIATLFFENTDFQTLQLRNNGKNIAEVTISGRKAGHETELATKIHRYELRCNGLGMLNLAGVPKQRMTTSAIFTFNDDFQPGPFSLSFFLHRDHSRIEIASPRDGSSDFKFKVVQHGRVVADSLDDLSLPGTREVAGLAEITGLGNPVHAETTMRELGDALKLKARRCRLDLGKSHAPGFLVTLDLLESESIKLYFTEAGELIRGETTLGLELLSHALIKEPLAAPNPPAS